VKTRRVTLLSRRIRILLNLDAEGGADWVCVVDDDVDWAGRHGIVVVETGQTSRELDAAIDAADHVGSAVGEEPELHDSSILQKPRETPIRSSIRFARFE
jgi:hypothetical protein